MNSVSTKVKTAPRLPAVVMLLMVSLATSSALPNTAYAEDPKETYEQARLAAELEFSEAIQQAKAEYKAISLDPNVDSETKTKAKEIYNKVVADAKKLRDQKIDQARQEYNQATNPPVTKTLAEARKELTKTIKDARAEYEKQIVEAQEFYKKAISEAKDDNEAEKLEEEYEQILHEIIQTYNDAVNSARDEYEKVQNSKNRGKKDA